MNEADSIAGCHSPSTTEASTVPADRIDDAGRADQGSHSTGFTTSGLEALLAVRVVATAARNHRRASASAGAAAVLIAAASASSQLAPDFGTALCRRGCDRRPAWGRDRDDQVSDRRSAIEAVDRNHRIRIDLLDYDQDGFRARKTRPDRGTSAMDDAQFCCCDGLRGESLRRLYSVAWAINGCTWRLPRDSLYFRSMAVRRDFPDRG